jgi:hypothetical protein
LAICTIPIILVRVCCRFDFASITHLACRDRELHTRLMDIVVQSRRRQPHTNWPTQTTNGCCTPSSGRLRPGSDCGPECRTRFRRSYCPGPASGLGFRARGPGCRAFRRSYRPGHAARGPGCRRRRRCGRCRCYDWNCASRRSDSQHEWCRVSASSRVVQGQCRPVDIVIRRRAADAGEVGHEARPHGDTIDPTSIDHIRPLRPCYTDLRS